MANKNYIVINGKKAELTEEQLKQLGIKVGKPKRWRGETQEVYYFIAAGGWVGQCHEFSAEADNFRYDVHNYFQTEDEAQEYARVIEIKRQLMRFADVHNDLIDWGTTKEKKWYLCITPRVEVIPACCVNKTTGIIYFSSKEIAEQAVKEIERDRIREYLLYGWCDYC